jgi:hypothetical protein
VADHYAYDGENLPTNDDVVDAVRDVSALRWVLGDEWDMLDT